MQNPKHSYIEWHTYQQGQPQPYSTIFQDVYYSSDNGLLETDYVFLQGKHFYLLKESTRLH
jgi:tRNA 5-methylaminomethyl-2-thiouridine biosynthesis bifunctional protein